MFAIQKSDIQRVTVSAFGALVVSAASIFGAVAPVKAATPVTAAAWQSQVEHRIASAADTGPVRFAPSAPRQAEIALHFTADGDFAGASLARSSGSKVIDARAMTVASRIAYPRLPAALRGQARDVAMVLTSGEVVAPRTGRVEVAANEAAGRIQVAAR